MNENVLITGASSGLGLEFAKLFAQKNYNLILIARDLAKLNDVKKELEKTYSKIHINVISKDLSIQTSAHELYEEIKSLGIKVDILINNAGFANNGNFWEIESQKDEDEININIFTLTVLTKLYLKEMVLENKGRILNIASVAGFLPGPLMAVYYSSKAYVIRLTESLAGELADTNVTISALCPGPTQTNFFNRANMENSNMVKSGLMLAEKVVEIGFNGLMKGKTIIVPGFKNKLSAFSSRFASQKLAAKITKQINK